MIDADIYDTVDPIIATVANQMHRRYGQFVERDDLTNQCWVWIMEHPDKIALWFSGDPASGERLLARSLRNECQDYGEIQKAAHLGYHREDLAYYSRAYLKELLDSFFDEEAWIYPERSGEGRRGSVDPALGNTWLATLSDISRVYKKLSVEDRLLLEEFHKDGMTNKMLAEMYEVSEQSMSYRHDRAVGRLLRLLGGPKPKAHDDLCGDIVGSRHVVSNAQALAIQSSYYDEG